MERTRTARRRRIALIAILMAVAAACAAWFRFHPHPVRRSTSHTFRDYLSDRRGRMVVYSPEFEARTDPGGVMRAQLSMLRPKFDGIVLYECDDRSDLILRTAESLGYRAALLTIWSPRSREEIERAAGLIRDHGAKLALAVSIGSEGIMEKRYGFRDLEAAQEELFSLADSKTAVETTTTEPWWLYTSATPDAERLRSFGDFLCINIHVIWDTDIASPQVAAAWTADRAKDLEHTTGRPVLIREGGFPGGGYSPRPNSTFAFTRSLQLGFWESWNTHFGIGAPPMVAFEGIDNTAKHWKTFESTWGLLDPDLRPYPAWDAFPDLSSQVPARQ